MTNKKSDKKLTGDLRNEFAELKQFYNKVAITIDDLKISDTNSVIRIIDNMIKTGLGNSVISIDSWNLKTRHLETEIATYKAEYKYPSELNNTIKIEKDGEILLEY